jgi:hypothetical protein
MAKLKEEESMRLSALHSQVVGSLELPTTQTEQEMPLHFLAIVPDHAFADAML